MFGMDATRYLFLSAESGRPLPLPAAGIAYDVMRSQITAHPDGPVLVLHVQPTEAGPLPMYAVIEMEPSGNR